MQELGGTTELGRELGAVRVQQFRGHPDRRQRGAQLVRHVTGEATLQTGQVLESADLALQAAGHVVERLPQPCDVVGAADLDPLREVTRGEPARGFGRDPYRPHHLPGHEQCDAEHEQHQAEAGQQHGALHQRDGLLLGGEREQVVQLEQPGAGLHGLADDQPAHELFASGTWRTGAYCKASRGAEPS